MKKNVASQVIGAQMCSATDGSDFTGAVTVYVTGNGGTQAVGSVGAGACTHEGNGFHTYAPAQSETNYDHVAFTFKGSGALTVTVQVDTTFPQTADAPTAAAIADAVWDEVITGHTTATTLGAYISNINATTTNGTYGNSALKTLIDTVDTVVDSILVDTAEIGAAGAGLTALASAANLATATGYIDTEVAAIKTVVDAILVDTAEIGAAGAGLTAVPWNTSWASNVAASVWNAATITYGSAGSYGLLIETNLDAPVSTAGGSSLTEAGIADAVWDEALAGHAVAGSAGAGLTAAGSAGDPWSTLVPGAYGAGTAGKILGDNLNATVSSRASQSSVDTVDDLLDTEVAAIKADTAAILIDTAEIGAAGAGLTALASASSLATVAGYVDTEVAAIKTVVDAILVDTAVIGVAGAGLTALATQASVNVIDDLLDTEVAAIKSVVDAVQVDTNDIQARLPAALTAGGNMKADSLAISGSTAAADNLEAHALRAVPVTFTSGTTTTAVLANVDGAAASSTDDVYNGRVLIFSAPTGLKDQGCSITDYVGATKTATISAVTIAVGATAAAVMV